MSGACVPRGSNNFPLDDTARPAINTPAHFVVGARASKAKASAGVNACRSPLDDPRDGTSLLLVRSLAGRGDYAVPAGRYGARRGELLRIDCVHLTALGLMRK